VALGESSSVRQELAGRGLEGGVRERSDLLRGSWRAHRLEGDEERDRCALGGALFTS
jgi:hypothetical protein